MSTRDISLVALMAAVIVALGLVPIIYLPIIPNVPITLQSMGVMTAGVLLGPKRGALACLVVIALVALGLPVLSGGRGGVGIFVGPTAGFLFGWVPSAFVAGFLAHRLDRPAASPGMQFAALFASAFVGGILVLYAIGVPWLAFVNKSSLVTTFVGSLIFLPLDLVKAVTAALVTVKVRQAMAIERK